MTEAIVVHTPPTPPDRLVLMFHGVGAHPEDLVPLGMALAHHLPHAQIVSIRSPHPCSMGVGWEWFSVAGVSEANRPERVAQAMPGFLDAVASWQKQANVTTAHTVLIGFSQGAIMALEASLAKPGLAGRVFALAGRLATTPQCSASPTIIHLLHGNQDPVMPVQLALSARQQLSEMGTQVTLQQFDGLAHHIDERVLEAILEHLKPCDEASQS